MKLMVGEGRNNFIIEWNENREDDLEPGHEDNFDSYETPNLESFKEDPIQEEERKEENLGDFDPSLN
jgi:hypothetical protein